MEALMECHSTILVKLMPLWTPVLFAYQVRIQSGNFCPNLKFVIPKISDPVARPCPRAAPGDRRHEAARVDNGGGSDGGGDGIIRDGGAG